MDLIKNLCLANNCLGVQKTLMMEARLRSLQKTAKLQPQQQILSNVLLSFLCILKGDHQEGQHLAVQALNQAEETGIHVFDFMVLGYRLYSWLGTGNLAEFPSFLTRLRAALTPYAIWDHAQYHYHVAWYALLTGDLSKARNEIDNAINLAESCGNNFAIALCRILKSQVYLELGLPAEADDLLTATVDELHLEGSATIQYLINLARAGCAFAQDRHAEAQRYSRAAFTVVRAGQGYGFRLV